MSKHRFLRRQRDHSRLSPRGLVAVAGLSAIGSSGYGTLTPALAELGDVYGVSTVSVGFLQGVVAVPGILLALVVGRVADLLGQGRVVLGCLVLFVASGTSCVFVDSFEVALLLRALQGIGFAGLLTIPPTVIGDRTTGDTRRRGVATNSMILTTASTVGPVVGGFLADTSDPRNTFWIYLLGIALIPSTIVVLGLGPGRRRTSRDGSVRQVLGELRTGGATGPVVGALALTLGTIVLVSAVTSALLPLMLLEDFSLDVSTRGIFIALANVGSVAASATLVVVAGRVGDRGGAVTGLLLMGTGLLAVALAPAPWVVAVFVLVFGFGVGLTYNSAVHQISRQEVSGRGLLMGAWSSAGRAGQFLGPVSGAWLATTIGTTSSNLVAAGCCGAAVIGVLVATRLLSSRSGRQLVQPQGVLPQDGTG